MSDINNSVFSGRLTSDPEASNPRGDMAICKFRVACNRKRKGETYTTYFPVTVFGKQAEICKEYLKKGRGVIVVGRFETDSYTDKNGVKRNGFNFIANDVSFLPNSKNNTVGTNNSTDNAAPTSDEIKAAVTVIRNER